MRIGRYEVDAIQTGAFALDGGAMFGVVPRALWERKIPADALHRIPMALRSLLVRGEGRVMLVDTGIGSTKWSERERARYAIDHGTHELTRALAAHGVAPEQVTDVLLTHLHFDHAGGATTEAPDGTLRPTFPKAAYYLQRRNLAWAEHPTEKDQASYLARDFQPIMDAGQLTLLDGPDTSGAALGIEGLELYVSDGHTEAQQLPILTDGTHTVAYGGDLLPTSAHVPIPWLMAYDIRPLQTMEEKRTLLARAARDAWTLVYEHDPRHAATRILETDRGFEPGDPVAI
ncbi:MAG: MBL fold metallo-hydrolase [Deltaproteobacteria bacterium]|nr:MBL fold metallo-hydrolase [Deltaproteobacteria bacterium]